MKKIAAFALVFISISLHSFAQNEDSFKFDSYNYLQSSGPGYHIVSFDGSQLGLWSLGYNPRYVLKDFNGIVALSISSPVQIGVSLSNFVGANYFMANVPVFAELGFGYLSSRNSELPVGLFIGGGLDVTFISGNEFWDRLFTTLPAVTTGVRLKLFNRSYSARVSKTLLIPKDNYYPSLSLSLHTNF